MARTADERLVREVDRMIRQTSEQSGLPYADTIGGCSPMSVRIIARRLGADIIETELGLGMHEIGLPAYFGMAVLIVNSRSRGAMRALGYCHGLGHLMAGELDVGEGADVQFMDDTFDYMNWSERRADLFGLANVCDRPTVRTLVDGIPADRAEVVLAAWIHTLAPDWPADRVRDRARLRLLLYEYRSDRE